MTFMDANKTHQQIINLIKSQSQENLPSGDELMSALGKEDTMNLNEWLDFMEPCDILLEKELCWPVEPEL